MSNDKNYVIQECAKLEGWLKEKGANGKSIKQMTLSIDGMLSYDVKMAIKHVNHIRHQFVTESSPNVDYQNMTKFYENMAFLSSAFNQKNVKKDDIYENIKDWKNTWDNSSTIGKVGLAGLGIIALIALGG